MSDKNGRDGLGNNTGPAGPGVSGGRATGNAGKGRGKGGGYSGKLGKNTGPAGSNVSAGRAKGKGGYNGKNTGRNENQKGTGVNPNDPSFGSGKHGGAAGTSGGAARGTRHGYDSRGNPRSAPAPKSKAKSSRSQSLSDLRAELARDFSPFADDPIGYNPGPSAAARQAIADAERAQKAQDESGFGYNTLDHDKSHKQATHSTESIADRAARQAGYNAAAADAVEGRRAPQARSDTADTADTTSGPSDTSGKSGPKRTNTFATTRPPQAVTPATKNVISDSPNLTLGGGDGPLKLNPNTGLVEFKDTNEEELDTGEGLFWLEARKRRQAAVKSKSVNKSIVPAGKKRGA